MPPDRHPPLSLSACTKFSASPRPLASRLLTGGTRNTIRGIEPKIHARALAVSNRPHVDDFSRTTHTRQQRFTQGTLRARGNIRAFQGYKVSRPRLSCCGVSTVAHSPQTLTVLSYEAVTSTFREGSWWMSRITALWPLSLSTTRLLDVYARAEKQNGGGCGGSEQVPLVSTQYVFGFFPWFRA